MENERMYNRMMDILQERAMRGEGYGDEMSGGWARGHKLTEAEYVKAFKKRMGSAQKAREAYRRKYGKGKTTKKTTKKKITQVEIDSMKVPELKKELKKRGFRGYSKLKKAQLQTQLKKYI